MGALKLIIAKEFNERVRKKSFLIGTLVVPLFFAVITISPALLANYNSDSEESKWNIVVLDQTDSIGSSLKSGDLITYNIKQLSEQEAKDDVKTNSNYQALLVISSDSDFSLYSKQQPSVKIGGIINQNITEVVRTNKIKSYNIKNIGAIISDINTKITVKDYKLTDQGDKKISKIAPLAVGFMFSILIYMFILMYGNQVSMSVIAEKNSRVIELIVSHIKPFWLMMGKIIGIGAVGLLQFIIWMGLSLIFSTIAKIIFLPDIDISQLQNSATALQQAGVSDSMQTLLITLTDPWYIIKIFGSFMIFFVGGYMLYGAMFAAIGSAVDNVQEVAQFTAPITMPLIISVVMIMFTAESPDNPISTALSYIPLTSPVIMMARIPSDSVTWYQFLISVTILIGTVIAVTYAAAKIFRVGIFMYGKKTSWKEITKWIKYN